MPVSSGLKNSLNRMREISSEIYHQYIPIIEDDTDIGSFAQPILDVPVIRNEFMSNLVNRIVYTQYEIKYFTNPLQVLEGDAIPLGQIGQEIYVNPAKGRKFNVEDFAGLLQKYEADVKVQYLSINMDLQYPLTISRQQLKKAFVSWDALDSFINGLSNSLYNGAYIDEFEFTKELVSSAYKSNQAVIEQVTAPTTKELAEQFITRARQLFLNFQMPSTQYNAWGKMNPNDTPIKTWTKPEDIVFLIRNDIRAFIDVNVLANAFNIDKTTLLGNILPVDNFDVYNHDTGVKVFDGSNIIGIIADKSWFKIKRQDMFLDDFKNANNRTWQYYLNLVKMYQYSLFANGVIFATKLPEVTITGLDYAGTTSVEIAGVGEKKGLDLNVTPITANTPEITYASSNEEVFTVEKDVNNDRHCVLTATGEGTANLTVTAGNVELTVSVTVTA